MAAEVAVILSFWRQLWLSMSSARSNGTATQDIQHFMAKAVVTSLDGFCGLAVFYFCPHFHLFSNSENCEQPCTFLMNSLFSKIRLGICYLQLWILIDVCFMLHLFYLIAMLEPFPDFLSLSGLPDALLILISPPLTPILTPSGRWKTLWYVL